MEEYSQVTTLITLEERRALEERAAKGDEHLNAARRAQADFLNYQERMKREREDLLKYGIERFSREVLHVFDDLRRSIDLASKEAKYKPLHEALVLMERNILAALGQHGISRLEAKSAPFNPAEHEALMMVDRPDMEPNMVVDVLRDGFRIHDRILRPAQVSVSRKPA